MYEAAHHVIKPTYMLKSIKREILIASCIFLVFGNNLLSQDHTTRYADQYKEVENQIAKYLTDSHVPGIAQPGIRC
jgi:hypothetical protein